MGSCANDDDDDDDDDVIKNQSEKVCIQSR
jgi:hypothetical protein